METRKLTRCGARFSNSQKFVVLRWTVKQRTKIQNECIVRPLFGSYNICLARFVIHQINAERLQKKEFSVTCLTFSFFPHYFITTTIAREIWTVYTDPFNKWLPIINSFLKVLELALLTLVLSWYLKGIFTFKQV